MNALVVDDSRAMRTIVGRLVKSLGFDVLEAGDGREALTVLATCPNPRVALVDWNMPNMNGLEFVQAVRADSRWSDVKIVMVTTESELPQIQKALAAGANEYVMKPFTVEMLKDKLMILGFAPNEGAARASA